MLKLKTKNYSDLKKDSCGACVIIPFVIVVADYFYTYQFISSSTSSLTRSAFTFSIIIIFSSVFPLLMYIYKFRFGFYTHICYLPCINRNIILKQATKQQKETYKEQRRDSNQGLRNSNSKNQILIISIVKFVFAEKHHHRRHYPLWTLKTCECEFFLCTTPTREREKRRRTKREKNRIDCFVCVCDKKTLRKSWQE